MLRLWPACCACNLQDKVSDCEDTQMMSTACNVTEQSSTLQLMKDCAQYGAAGVVLAGHCRH